MIWKRSHIFIMFLWILNATLRIVFGIMTITQGSLLDVEVALIVEQTITVMFLTLGVLGFAAVPGLLDMKDWGIQIAVITSFATIIFDVWGVTIQFTALMGFFVPIVTLLYIFNYRRRQRMVGTE